MDWENILAFVALGLAAASFFNAKAARKDAKLALDRNAPILDAQRWDLEEKAKSKRRAEIKLEVVKSGSDRLRVTNVGASTATELSIASQNMRSELVSGEIERSFPTYLDPGQSLSLTLGLSGDSNANETFQVSWQDGEGLKSKQIVVQY